MKNVQQVRVVPRNNFIVVEVLYKVDCKIINRSTKSYCSVDLGLNNLITCAFPSDKPLIVNGRPLKSINSYYNKNKSRLQSLLKDGRKTSNRIQSLTLKRNNKITDYLHKASKMFVNQLVSKGIADVVVGYNKEWKQGINIGKVNNQNFVSIPHYRLLNMLTYKCELEGIALHITEESYTSKCSFLDSEAVCKHGVYKGFNC